ncbi:MAG TPA: acyl-CoA dehydrogenase family protein, partial [Blastocatellia bacterium]|nr:acyl-CoA dehydrogenase family protein [Blastocatellia bacterium]
AIECSIIKVYGSEILGYCADEAVQVFGGNGYSADYPVERTYRDARINRIFEGTNEINRLIMSGQMLRKAMKGELAIFPAAKRLMDELLSPSMPEEAGDAVFAEERVALSNAKKIVIAVLGSAAQKYRDKVQEEQEVLAAASDIIMDVYGIESSILRTEKLISRRGEESCRLQIYATRTFTNDAMLRIDANAKKALAAMSDGDELRTMLTVLRRLTKFTPVNTIVARRRIADAIIETGRYCL